MVGAYLGDVIDRRNHGRLIDQFSGRRQFA